MALHDPAEPLDRFTHAAFTLIGLAGQKERLRAELAAGAGLGDFFKVRAGARVLPAAEKMVPQKISHLGGHRALGITREDPLETFDGLLLPAFPEADEPGAVTPQNSQLGIVGSRDFHKTLRRLVRPPQGLERHRALVIRAPLQAALGISAHELFESLEGGLVIFPAQERRPEPVQRVVAVHARGKIHRERLKSQDRPFQIAALQKKGGELILRVVGIDRLGKTF